MSTLNTLTGAIRNVSEPDLIPNENNNLQSDNRFTTTKGGLNNLASYEKEMLPQHTTGLTGVSRPLGTSTTSVGYAQTPIGHGTHPTITPSSPTKLRGSELREVESNIPTTSGFSTIHTGPIQSGFRDVHQPIITGTSHVGTTHETLGTNVISTGPAHIVSQRTVPLESHRINALEGSAISEIRGTHDPNFNESRQIESPNHLSRWEVQQNDVSSMRYENHQAFENWESNRHAFVTDRRNVMDDLLAGMDKKLDWLELGIHKVIQFFRERALMEERYSKVGRQHLPQLGEHFEKVDDPVLFGNFSRGMKENDAFHAQDRRNSEILANFIKKDILDWILLPAEKDYKLQSSTLKGPMKEFRRRLDYSASSRNRSYKKYFKNYDSLQKSSKLTPNEDNIFKRQLKYSLNAREELRLLKLYNEQGLLVISEFTRLATTRLNEIQRAFSLYLQKYLELYQSSAATPEPILELIEGANGAEAVQSLFLPKNLLTYANIEFLKRQLNRDEINYNDLTTYLVNFPDSVDPARSSFITREWDAVKVGGFFHSTKPCVILATNNNNLLIIEKKFEDNESGKVKNPFHLRFTNVNKVYTSSDGSGTIVSILERTPGNVFNHTAKAKLKFETAEEAQRFLDFLASKAPQNFEATNSAAGQFVTSQYIPGGSVNTSVIHPTTTSVYQADPYSRSLGSQIQAGQIVSTHTISERPVLTQTQSVVTSHQPHITSSIGQQSHVLSSNVVPTGQPHIVSSTVLKSEPVPAHLLSREQHVVGQTIRQEATQLGGSNTTANFISHQMTGEI